MSKIAQIYYYDPQSAGINLQSPQSDSTPWTLTLSHAYFLVQSYLLDWSLQLNALCSKLEMKTHELTVDSAINSLK